MSNKICSTKQEVEEFLKELKNIINSKGFNVYKDLDILLKKSKERNRRSVYYTEHINRIRV